MMLLDGVEDRMMRTKDEKEKEDDNDKKSREEIRTVRDKLKEKKTAEIE